MFLLEKASSWELCCTWHDCRGCSVVYHKWILQTRDEMTMANGISIALDRKGDYQIIFVTIAVQDVCDSTGACFVCLQE